MLKSFSYKDIIKLVKEEGYSYRFRKYSSYGWVNYMLEICEGDGKWYPMRGISLAKSDFAKRFAALDHPILP